MNDLCADSPALGLVRPEPHGAGWPLNRWLVLIALVFAVHVALLFVFGARKQVVSRAVAVAPTLRLTDRSDELLALNNPTLFTLPHSRDFVATAWSQPMVVNQPTNRWTEPPRWLPLPADELMAAFNQFMQTNRFAGFELRLKPPVSPGVPARVIEPALAQNSTMRIEGDLTQRRLLTTMDLPSWPYADVIAPSKVQMLVNGAGDVVSVTLLPSDNSLEALSHYDAADQRALELARAARFAPATHLTIGQMVFNWRTVPPVTNPPPGPP